LFSANDVFGEKAALRLPDSKNQWLEPLKRFASLAICFLKILKRRFGRNDIKAIGLLQKAAAENTKPHKAHAP
jgi:hypothetical protein